MIRDISENDIGECFQLIRDSFTTVADEFGFTPENAPDFTSFAITENILLCQFKDNCRLMRAYRVTSGKIAGYYSLYFRNNKECELNNLCVLPSYRHKSIGTDLLNDAFSKALDKGCNRINIGIVAENTVLRKWYEKNGFVYTGTKKLPRFPFSCGYMEKLL